MSNIDSAQLGTLILAGTCLGQATDIPLRSLEALRNSDCLVFEEDRPARLALKTAGIHRDYLKYSEHDQKETLNAIKQYLKRGKTVVYMSDQGMPTIADPGRKLLELAYQLGARVSVIPGPSSITAALTACPFLGERFVYQGFLAREPAKREKEIIAIQCHKDPVVILETPYRRAALLSELARVLGENRKALLAVDITGQNEMFLFKSLGELKNEAIDKRLNFVIIIEPLRQQKPQKAPKKRAKGDC